jgi:hypothetical protein
MDQDCLAGGGALTGSRLGARGRAEATVGYEIRPRQREGHGRARHPAAAGAESVAAEATVAASMEAMTRGRRVVERRAREVARRPWPGAGGSATGTGSGGAGGGE